MSAANDSYLAIENMTFSHAGSHQPLYENFTFHVDAGERVALLGSSGSGKTTLLHLIAGFNAPQEGAITLQGEKLNEPDERRGIVLQRPVLFPWLTTLQYVALGETVNLKRKYSLQRRLLSKEYKKEIAKINLRAAGFLLEFGLMYEDLTKHPQELSGGMQRRMEIAQIMMGSPQVMIFDEPLSAFDPVLQKRMLEWIRGQLDKHAMTSLIVSHSIREAIQLATRIVIVSEKPVAVVYDEKVDLSKIDDELYVTKMTKEIENVMIESQRQTFTRQI